MHLHRLRGSWPLPKDSGENRFHRSSLHHSGNLLQWQGMTTGHLQTGPEAWDCKSKKKGPKRRFMTLHHVNACFCSAVHTELGPDKVVQYWTRHWRSLDLKICGSVSCPSEVSDVLQVQSHEAGCRQRWAGGPCSITGACKVFQ